MNFSKDIVEDVIIHKVHIKRATFREADEFKEIIKRDINNGNRKIIIDMAACEFMDSAFLGLLISTANQLQKKQGFLKLAGVHDDAQVILEITKTGEMFNIYPSVEEALKSSFSY